MSNICLATTMLPSAKERLVLPRITRYMGSHKPSSEDLPLFLEDGCCYARSCLSWLEIVPT